MKIIVFSLFVSLVIALVVIGVTAVRPALDTAVTLAAQPDSVAATIMRSRQTAPAAPEGNSGWIVAALFGLGTAAVAGVLAYLRFGAEFLRQRRLTNRRQSHAPRTLPQMPYSPMLPGQQPYQLPTPDYQAGEGYSD